MKRILLIVLFVNIAFSQQISNMFNISDEYDKGFTQRELGGIELMNYLFDGKFGRYPNSHFDMYYKVGVATDTYWHRIVLGRGEFCKTSGDYTWYSDKFWTHGSYGSGDLQFSFPKGIAMTYHSPNHVALYIADSGNNRIVKLIVDVSIRMVRYHYYFNNFNNTTPVDVEVDHKNNYDPSDDEIWVITQGYSQFQRPLYHLTGDGTFIDSYGFSGSGEGRLYKATSISLHQNLNEMSTDVNNNGGIIISDNGNNRVVKLSYVNGSYTWDSSYSFSFNTNITCVQSNQNSNDFYAVDNMNHKIYKFLSNYSGISFAGEYGSKGKGTNQLYYPNSIHLPLTYEYSPNKHYGHNEAYIGEGWTYNSGIKVGWVNDVYIRDITVTLNEYGNKANYSFYTSPNAEHPRWKVFNKSGVLISGDQDLGTGTHRSGTWNGKDFNGTYQPEGDYRFEISAESSTGSIATKFSEWFHINPRQIYTAIPYSTGFEETTNKEIWSLVSTLNGFMRVSSDYSPHSGSRHLLMGTYISGNESIWYARNSAKLYVDLSGHSSEKINLDFWWKDFGDDDHTDDGIFIADDGGINFTKIYSLTTSQHGVWKHIIIDLSQKVIDHSLNLTNTFVIKFQQYDNWRVPTEGFAFDDISVGIVPLRVTISGPTSVPAYQSRRFDANPSGGAQPYTNYKWEVYIPYGGDPPDAESPKQGKNEEDAPSAPSGTWSTIANGPTKTYINRSAGKSYSMRCTVTDSRGATAVDGHYVTITGGGGGGHPKIAEIPEVLVLSGNYPNPFNPSTTIRFGLPEAQHVKLTVYNIAGQKVISLADQTMEKGYHDVTWNGLNQTGSAVSSGLYIYTLEAGGKRLIKKMLFVK